MAGASVDLNDEALSEDLEDDLVQEVLKSGTDLREYSADVEKELTEAENKTIENIVKEAENIASLHNQITSCDNILEVDNL